MLKRIFDITASFFGLLILSPFLAVLSLLIALKLGWPVLFTQVRPGLHGQPFNIFKFRTMTNARDDQGELLPDSVRLTGFGKMLRKLSLDELPELINVLKGDMSLVGPRPLLMEYLPRYNDFQARRHEVRPGITGWAQVNGRNAIAWEQKFELDVWYIDNQTFCLDLKILWFTFVKVIKREGINAAGSVSGTPFMGNKENSKSE